MSYLKIMVSVCAILLLSIFVTKVHSLTPDLGDDQCASLLLVSSWTRNNVKIYDGCSGEFIKDLDSQGLIQGPLGILEAPDGDLLVISETNGRLLKFDRQTLSKGTVILGDDPATNEVEDNFIAGPSGAVLDQDGFLYAASFTRNSVVKIDTQTWQIVDEMLAANSGQISGIDAGLAISESGELYLPGYNSDNIIKINLSTKAVSEVVSAGRAGLNAPRTILLRGQELVVTGEQSNNVMVFDNTTGAFKQTILDLDGPTGMMADGDNHFIINNSRAVFRVRNDGSDIEQLVASGAGSLTGGTFVYRLHKTSNDSDQDGLTDDEETDTYGTDPNNADTDSDGLSDGDEIIIHSTNPLLADSDSDGINDDYEIANSLNPNTDDAALDLDEDGLTNFEEYQLGTLANKSDTDGDGEADGVDSNPLIPNTAPELFGVPELSVDQDSHYEFVPEVSYPGDLSTVSFSIANQPQWASFDQQTGELSGVPNNSDVGVTNGIQITATNGHHLVPMDSFSLTVININDAPSLVSSIPAQTVTIGNNLTVQVSNFFTDIDTSDTLVYSATGLPDGVTISEAGAISGSPTITGQYQITVTATDSSDVSASANFTLTVNEEVKSSGGGSFGLLLSMLLLIFNRRFVSPKGFQKN